MRGKRADSESRKTQQTATINSNLFLRISKCSLITNLLTFDEIRNWRKNSCHFDFSATWYLMTIKTQDVQTPGGLFLQGMIIGCALGLIV